MKKKNVLLIVFIILVLALVSVAVFSLEEKQDEDTSATTNPTTNATTNPTTELVYGKWFDFQYETNRDDPPDRETAQQITAGMSVSEVYAIMGKPRRDVGSGLVVLEWVLSSGEVLTVSFGLDLEAQGWKVIGSGIA